MFVPSNNWRNSNEGFRKDESYDHIKSQKKQGFYPSLENTVLGEP